ncbi:MAG TPA: hypothetical protein VE173_00065 [Longimicrobiales bacterium]|nr:hypothetical protein [Longimicrobiales bacterium]
MRRAVHTSGLVQYRARTSSARCWLRASHRRTWASSCTITARSRLSGHPTASRGSSSTGLRTPHVTGTGNSAV